MLVVGLLREVIKNRCAIKNHVIPAVVIGAIILTAFNIYSFILYDDLLVFLIFIILIPIFVTWNFDIRIAVGYAIFLLALAGGIPSIGNQLAIFAYWLLVVGVSCLLINLFREKAD